jgi:SAM-dependent methyltransferase
MIKLVKMTVPNATRVCPICAAERSRHAYPYAIRFDDQIFFYFRCSDCATVFVDPLPTVAQFGRMYESSAYHDVHYSDSIDYSPYVESVKFLSAFAQPGATVLDYGCGTGQFMKACQESGFATVGVEFDSSIAGIVSERLGSPVVCVEEFDKTWVRREVDVIHFGDVLEHLPDPLTTLTDACRRLRVGGVLYAEGPLEVNPSPVYWAARLYGEMRHFISGRQIGSGRPTHLLRTSGLAQRRFFARLGKGYAPVAWKVEESGWPYAQGGWAKRTIASVARAVGGYSIAGTTFGNRFRIVLRRRS